MFKPISFKYDSELKREIELRGLSNCTFENYRSQLRRMAGYFNKDIADVSVEEAKQYLHYLSAELKRNPQTINVCRAAFYFFKRCVHGEEISPYALPKRKVTLQLPDILSLETILVIFENLHLKQKAVLSLCYGSGLRISEALNVQVEDIDSEKMQVFVRKGKGGDPRYTILSKQSLLILRQYYSHCRPKKPFLFPHRNNDDISKNPQYAQKIFVQIYKHLYPQSNKRITTHTLRHCFATHLLESGVDIRTIQALLGHKSIHSTSRYLHITTKRFSQLVSPLDRKEGDSLV